MCSGVSTLCVWAKRLTGWSVFLFRTGVKRGHQYSTKVQGSKFSGGRPLIQMTSERVLLSIGSQICQLARPRQPPISEYSTVIRTIWLSAPFRGVGFCGFHQSHFWMEKTLRHGRTILRNSTRRKMSQNGLHMSSTSDERKLNWRPDPSAVRLGFDTLLTRHEEVIGSGGVHYCKADRW